MNDKKKGLTSLEAAALYLSDGRTKDPVMAQALDESRPDELDMDGLQRAHLRRMMGFDFEIKFRPNKVHVTSRQKPYVSTHMKLKEGDAVETPQGYGLTNEAALDRLVEACARLKEKWEEQQV